MLLSFPCFYNHFIKLNKQDHHEVLSYAAIKLKSNVFVTSYLLTVKFKCILSNSFANLSKTFFFCFRLIYCIPDSLIHESSFFQRLKAVVPHIELYHGVPNISKLQLDLDKLPCLVIMDDLVSLFLIFL